MTTVGTRVDFEVRAYQDHDERGVLSLLDRALGGGPAGERSPEFFRWKHLENPFGRSFMTVAVADDGDVIGFRAFMRWRFRAGDATVRAVRAVDTATHPDHQRRGVFSRLTGLALDRLSSEADLIFNTPNGKSGPGYLKLGWLAVGTLPVAVRVRHPVAVGRARGGRRQGEQEPFRPPPPVTAARAVDVLADTAGVARLLERVVLPERSLATLRSVDYLHWRYGRAPLLDYRAVAERRQGELAGVAIFRVRPRGRLWETTVAEVLVADDDGAVASRLLRKVVAAARVDHLTCSFPDRSAARRAARRRGFCRVPGGIVLVAKPLRPDLDPRPDDLRSWALSLGDVEVF